MVGASACAERAPSAGLPCVPAPRGRGPDPDGRREARVVRAGSFAFHSGFWLNLHHFLYARAASGDQEVSDAKRIENDAEPLAPKARAEWAKALELYRSTYATRDLLFDDELGAIKVALAAHENDPAIALDGSAPLARVLAAVAPSYAERAWPKHDEMNRVWVDAVGPLIEKHGRALTSRLTDLFHTEWPPGETRIDVCSVTNWSGAYTSLAPVHIVIASGDARNQGPYALEIVIHETSHGMIRPIRDAIDAEYGRLGKEPSKSLWHALLFYTTGMAVRELFPDHQPYADREKLWKGEWEKYRVALAGPWQRHLDGADSYEVALRGLVGAVAS